MTWALIAMLMTGYSEADLRGGKLPEMKIVRQFGSEADCEQAKVNLEVLGPVYVALTVCPGTRPPVLSCVPSSMLR